jgi:integrase
VARLKSGSVPSYRYHKARNCAVVTLDGKDHYLGPYQSLDSVSRYDRLVAEWLARGRVAAPPVGNADPADASTTDITVSGLVLAYWRHALDYYQESPAERERIRLAVRPLRRLFGRAPASDFGPLKLRTLREHLLAEQPRRVKLRDKKRAVVGEKMVNYRLSRRTINQRIGVIKRMFRWASSVELVPVAVSQALATVEGLKRGRTKAPEPRKVRPVPTEVVDATLPHANRHVRAMIEFQRLTGARSGEVCRLRMSAVETNGIADGLPNWIYRPEKHKNDFRGTERVIYIGPKAQDVLKPFLTGNPDEWLFSPAKATTERYARLRGKRLCPVYPSSDRPRKSSPIKRPGPYYSVRTYRQAVRRACSKAGLPPWHPHQLRHTAATYLRKEFGVEVARVILGHASAFTTEIYAEADRQKAAAAMAIAG